MTAEPISIDAARRDMYRRQILNAAELEFSRTGFANTKMSAIAKAADLSLATVYKTFTGKSEVWDTLHRSRMDELLARVEADAVTSHGPLERLLAGVSSVVQYLTDHPTYLAMNLWAGTGWASGEQMAHGVQESVWSAGLDTMAAGIENALSAREISPIDPRLGARLIVSTMQVWLTTWLEDPRPDSSQALVEDLCTRLRWMLCGTAD